jgi:6,7-dimethyl-8-ribityllumazine synthase
MRNAERGEPARLDGRDLRIAIVQARFNAELTDSIARACTSELVTLNALADADDHDALVAIGCVIRGETYHFELVANESAAAVTRVGIDHGLAIANAILTCDTPAQAQARAEEKGRDAARVAVEMANLLDELS